MQYQLDKSAPHDTWKKETDPLLRAATENDGSLGLSTTVRKTEGCDTARSQEILSDFEPFPHRCIVV